MERILTNHSENRVSIPLSAKPNDYKRIGSSLDRGLVGAEQPDMSLTKEQADFVSKHPVVKGMLDAKTLTLH